METIPANWARLIRLVEAVGFGEVRIIVQNGKPVRAEGIVKSVKLDNPDEFSEGLSLVVRL